MAAIVLADVTALCSDVTAVPAMILTWVNGNGIDPEAFDGEDGNTTKMARCYLAAHFALVNPDGGAAGAITSETEGSISRSYAANALSPSELNRTGHGQSFRFLCRMHSGGAHLA